MKFSKICSLSSQKYLLVSSMWIKLGCKMPTFSTQYIEHKISIFNEISNLIKEKKNILRYSRGVTYPFKTCSNTILFPFSLYLEHITPKFKIEVQNP